MKTIFGWIFAIIMATIIFCVWIMLIPMQTKVAEKIELTYIFVDENGNPHDIFEPVHGAATDWSFLFESEENDTGVVLNEDNTTVWTVPNIDYLTEIDEENTWEIENNETEIDLDILIKEVDSIKNDIETKEYDKCTTPWNTSLEHWESVIAYEQRDDVPNICNAQRRTCDDWILNGNFEQWACQEDIEYKYTRVKVISYNSNKPGELIQNPKYAKNDWAEFDTDGKIKQISEEPNTNWDNSVKDKNINEQNIKIWQNSYYNCTTPWWEIVQHGQFIKAYESELWFTDQQCQVEIRLCLDWKLNWRYSNKKCEYIWVTSQDYKWWNTDVTKPTQELLDEIENEDQDKKWFFGWIAGWFR
jgi:hypothetical protein